jgi:hypothetical protein
MQVTIDTNAIKKHAEMLQAYSRSAFAVAVRQTLNKAAYDLKQNTMPASAKESFIQRKENFFKSSSKVEQAQGFDVNSMRAIVGFLPKQDAKDTSVQDLEAQEQGGDIAGRAFIPLAQNRVGNNWNRNVRTQGRYRAVKDKIVNSADSKAANKAGQFRSTAKYAGVGGIVIGNIVNDKGNRMVWRITSLNKRDMKMTALFALKKDREVQPQATRFMRKSSLKSAAKMQQYFIELAEKKLLQLVK